MPVKVTETTVKLFRACSFVVEEIADIADTEYRICLHARTQSIRNLKQRCRDQQNEARSYGDDDD